jgi:hypothetical protein
MGSSSSSSSSSSSGIAQPHWAAAVFAQNMPAWQHAVTTTNM